MRFQAQIVPSVNKEYVSFLLILLFSRYHKKSLHYLLQRSKLIQWYETPQPLGKTNLNKVLIYYNGHGV